MNSGIDAEKMNVIDLLNNYNNAIEDCIHHNYLIKSLNAKLSKEFFTLFRIIYEKIESFGSESCDFKNLQDLYRSVVFLRSVESFATLTKKIIFSTSTLEAKKLDEYKHKIIEFYREINYPIDLENFVYDY